LFVEFGTDCERDVVRTEEKKTSEHFKMRRSGESVVVGFTLFLRGLRQERGFVPLCL
jgi:hypothetical protein